MSAKIDLKFIAWDCDYTTIETFVNSDKLDIVITIKNECGISTICLDKSTAIKFAKTLRTEINKIQD
tara:strand:+ start:295 stop:495 length:201 start_codon:yes stop_codon:yes gene_type:complete